MTAITAAQALELARNAKALRPSDGNQKSPAEDPYFRNKDFRTAHYLQFVYGWKQRTCTACGGSGHYDHNGSPECGGCDGTGKEQYPGELAWTGPGSVTL